MKTQLHYSCALLAGASLLLTTSIATAHSYGVSSSGRGRGTEYTDARGGSAYVGPHGAAAKGANGNSAAVTANGAAYHGQNGQSGYTTTGSYNSYHYGTTYNGSSTTVVAAHPSGYVSTIPSGYTTAYYGGYNCYYVGGIYYRPIFYGGATVYVVVQ